MEIISYQSCSLSRPCGLTYEILQRDYPVLRADGLITATKQVCKFHDNLWKGQVIANAFLSRYAKTFKGRLKVQFQLVMVGSSHVKWGRIWLSQNWKSIIADNEATATLPKQQEEGCLGGYICSLKRTSLVWKWRFFLEVLLTVLTSAFSRCFNYFSHHTLFSVRPLFFLPTKEFQPWCFSDNNSHRWQEMRDFCMYFLLSTRLVS